MGYEIHITRAEHWDDNAGKEISRQEWHDVINSDPELTVESRNGPDFAVWHGHPTDKSAWLNWCEGNVSTKNPDEPLIRKMAEIAKCLGAQIQGDDGELYDESGQIERASTTSPFGKLSLMSLVLSIVSICSLAALVSLDPIVRQQVTDAPSMNWGGAILFACMIAVGVLAWLGSTAIAIATILRRQPCLRYSGIALLINTLTAAVIVMAN